MAEINLLQPEQISASSIVGRSKFIVSRMLMVILVLIMAGYGYLFIEDSRVSGNIEKTQAKITQAQSVAMNNQDRAELLTRQGQLKELDKLVKDHMYWSYMLSDLAKITFKNAKYSNFEADTKGKMWATVNVSTYEELDKFVQVFNLPEYNKEFSDVRVITINKEQDANTGVTVLKARLQLTFNPEYIKGRF